VHLEPGATLILDAARPYGGIRLDRQHNLDLDSAEESQVSIGAGVVLKKGVRVTFHIGPGGRLVIPPGRVIDQDIQGEVEAFEKREL
jgi:hypothetical protein